MTPKLLRPAVIAATAFLGLMTIPFAQAASHVTPREIQTIIAQGHPQRALAILAPVLKRDPHSAKAWYLQAEAKDLAGKTSAAHSALLKAEHLNPSMPFANPKRLHELERRVGVHNVAATRAARTRDHILFIVLLLLFVAAGALILYRRRLIQQRAGDVEAERTRLLQLITSEVEELRMRKTSAELHDNSDDIGRLTGAIEIFVRASRDLLDAETGSVAMKEAAIQNAKKAVNEANRCTGTRLSGGYHQPTTHETPDRAPAHPAHRGGQPGYGAAYAPSVAPGMAYQTPVADPLMQGMEFGMGMEMAEDVMRPDQTTIVEETAPGAGQDPSSGTLSNFGGSADSGLQNTFAPDPGGFGGPSDTGLGAGGSSGFGSGADDGLSSGGSGGFGSGSGSFGSGSF